MAKNGQEVAIIQQKDLRPKKKLKKWPTNTDLRWPKIKKILEKHQKALIFFDLRWPGPKTPPTSP